MEPLHLAHADENPAGPFLVRREFASTALDVRRALVWLDNLIREALVAAAGSREPAAGSDPFRGLHISEAEVARLIEQPPGEPLLAARDLSARVDALPVPRALAPFVRACGLDDFDLATILIASAPELDLRYERLYAYLQDDVERRRPTVNLVLDLLCGSLASKIRGRAHFVSDAPLLRHRLIHLSASVAQAEAPLLAQRVRLDPQVLAALLGEASLDPRLACACRLSRPVAVPAEGLVQAAARGLPELARRYQKAGEPLRLYLQGGGSDDKRDAAACIASELGAALLHVDLARLLAAPLDFELALILVGREASLKD